MFPRIIFAHIYVVFSSEAADWCVTAASEKHFLSIRIGLTTGGVCRKPAKSIRIYFTADANASVSSVIRDVGSGVMMLMEDYYYRLKYDNESCKKIRVSSTPQTKLKIFSLTVSCHRWERISTLFFVFLCDPPTECSRWHELTTHCRCMSAIRCG